MPYCGPPADIFHVIDAIHRDLPEETLAEMGLSRQAIDDFAASLKPLGAPTSFEQAAEQLRGGMTFRVFRLGFSDATRRLVVTTYTMPDGKLEQFLLEP